MCGIYGYLGKKNAIKKSIEGLHKLEYRGYDSAGIAYVRNKKIVIEKSLGNVQNLKELLNFKIKSNLAIAHTRWATHGKISLENCHPHSSENFVLVHNGIIENYDILKKDIDEQLDSQTDSEIIVKIVEKFYKNSNKNLKNDEKILQSIQKTINVLKGSWACLLIEKNKPDKIYIFKNKSPLLIAVSKEESIIASDIYAMSDDKNAKYKYFNVKDFNIGKIEKNNFQIYNKNLKKIKLKSIKNNCENINLENDCKHKMLKEIKEIPFAIKATKKGIKNNSFKKLASLLNSFSNITIVGCGSAYHAGLYGKYIIEKHLKVNVNVELASEYRYKTQINNQNELVLAISQSGETADTLAAIEIAKEKGVKTAVITNVSSSSITRICDYVILTCAGKEIAVAATKTYATQLLALYMLTMRAKKKRISKNIEKFAENTINAFDFKKFLSIKNFQKFFFIGRLSDSITAFEASLKIKEIAYVHSEGYPAGELKHGTLSLLDDKSLVFAIVTQKSILEKTLNAVNEVKARGAKVVIITQYKNEIKEENLISLQKINEDLMPIISIIPLQLFAYNVSVLKGLNPDRPRNLAKSVTVE